MANMSEPITKYTFRLPVLSETAPHMGLAMRTAIENAASTKPSSVKVEISIPHQRKWGEEE